MGCRMLKTPVDPKQRKSGVTTASVASQRCGRIHHRQDERDVLSPSGLLVSPSSCIPISGVDPYNSIEYQNTSTSHCLPEPSTENLSTPTTTRLPKWQPTIHTSPPSNYLMDPSQTTQTIKTPPTPIISRPPTPFPTKKPISRLRTPFHPQQTPKLWTQSMLERRHSQRAKPLTARSTTIITRRRTTGPALLSTPRERSRSRGMQIGRKDVAVRSARVRCRRGFVGEMRGREGVSMVCLSLSLSPFLTPVLAVPGKVGG